jgi:hypothetical protein
MADATPPTDPEEISFFRRLGKNIKEYLAEVLGSLIIYLVVLGIIQVVGYVILQLNLPEHQKTWLKNFDFGISMILIFFFAATSLYKLGKIFVNENSEIKAIFRAFPSLGPPTQPATQSRFTVKDVLHRIAEVLVLISIFVTVSFAVNDNYLFSFAIPATGTLKGILVISDLPSDIRVFASFCLLLLITGGAIVATHAFSRKEFVSAWLIAASGSLGTGIGMLAGIGHIQMKRRKRTTNGKH